MANIRENKKNGKVISFRFTACVERNVNGRQIRRYTTWQVPADLSPAKAKKAAMLAAEQWENEIRTEYQKEKELGINYQLSPNKRRDSFGEFVNDVWLPLQVCNGNSKPTTMAFYKNMSRLIVDYWNGAVLQDISPMSIQRFLIYLNNDYTTSLGERLAAKTIRHYYNVLKKIFAYAEKIGMLAYNPMDRVDAPKKDKKPVDALTLEQAKEFLCALAAEPLDFCCMMQLFLTAGIRRGECLGLQWQDIDEQNSVIYIRRSVVYTPASGTIVSTPKTADSIRAIPLMPSVLHLLHNLQRQTTAKNVNAKVYSRY